MALLNSPIIPSTPGSGQRTSALNNELFYPLDMGVPGGIDISEKRPIIMFTCSGRDGFGQQYICFPIPQGLEFSDGASYDDASLGYIGAGAAAITKGISESKLGDTLKNSVNNGGIDSVKDLFGTKSAAVAALNVIDGVSDSAKSAVSIGMKATMNRHIVTEFTGIATRSYGFKFKMVASSQKESDVIKNITTAFRNGLYPEADELALKYPPTWTIRFMKGGTDISYIPKIWECYLTSLNVSYNSSANLWHEDGSPIECDVTVAFKETRALRHQDIKELDVTPFVSIDPKNRDGYKVVDAEPLFGNNTGQTTVAQQKDTDK